MIGPRQLQDALEQELPMARSLRRELHVVPDLSGQETGTLSKVLEHVPDGLTVEPMAGTGAVVRAGGPGAAVLLRAELDALPVTETTGVSWISARPGVMHACGHDVHIAAAVAVLRAVSSCGGEVPLVLAFQPREESYPSGALEMVQAGVLAEHEVGAAIAAHVQPGLRPGQVACVPDGVNASSDEFEITVQGRAGHAAYPHLCTDPVTTLCAIVMALQTVVSRATDPMLSAVVGVSTLRAGEAANAIPGTASARGSLRALSPDVRVALHRQVKDIATLTAQAHGCSATVTFTDGEPVLQNNPELVRLTAARLVDDGVEVCSTLRTLGADDFSYFAELVPSVMTFVGCESNGELHSGDFLPSDADVDRVARAMLASYFAAGELVTQK